MSEAIRPGPGRLPARVREIPATRGLATSAHRRNRLFAFSPRFLKASPSVERENHTAGVGATGRAANVRVCSGPSADGAHAPDVGTSVQSIEKKPQESALLLAEHSRKPLRSV